VPAPSPYRPIVGTLVYVLDRARGRVLMVRRDARPGDDHFGKYNGLGGKLERDEDVVACARREVMEEAGIALTSLTLRGTLTWSGFGPRREDWLGFVFLADRWTGTPAAANHEGTLGWVPLERVLAACAGAGDLPMWAGDRHFVPLVFDDDPRVFHGTMPYDVDRPLGWTVVRLG
jgi:8-oxo-dGTP diphosphatase